MSEFDPEALIDATAPLIGLSIGAAYRPGVVLHLLAAEMTMKRLSEVPLDDADEPAPVFRPEPLE